MDHSVEQKHQQKGIGRELISRAMQQCIAVNTELTELTVNSSPNAVTAYRAMGFIEREEEKTVNGIRFVPMFLEIKKALN